MSCSLLPISFHQPLKLKPKFVLIRSSPAWVFETTGVPDDHPSRSEDDAKKLTPPAIVEPVSGTVAVYLKINDQFYAAKCMRTPVGKTFRVRRPDGQTYDVHHGSHGLECTCWDFIYRWANRDGKGCKHCAALKAAGLLD